MERPCLFLAISILTASTSYGTDMSNHVGSSLQGGGVMSVHGNFDGQDNLSDVFGSHWFPALAG